MSLIEKEMCDQIKAHKMAEQYYLNFKKQFEHRKIVDYVIARGSLVPELHRIVETFIKDGYEPFGSPFFTEYQKICFEGNTSMQEQKYHQAMVKYE